MVDNVKDIYTDLIIRQYRNDKFIEYVGAFLDVISDASPYDEYLELFALETAPSFALDNIGAWVGIDRFYSGGALNDQDFIQIIKLRITQNKSNHSLGDISTIMKENFGDFIRVLDTNTMELVYYVEEANTTLFEIALEKGAIPKPMGVQINFITVPDPYKVFGFFTGSDNTVGFSLKNTTPKEGRFLRKGDIQ